MPNQMTETLIVDYAVLGFSISGVAAALELSLRSASVCIIEYNRDTASFPGMYYIFQTPINPIPLRGLEFEEVVKKRLNSAGVNLFFDSFLVEKISLCSDGAYFELYDYKKINNIKARHIIFSPNGTEIGCKAKIDSLYGFGVSSDAYSDHTYFCGKSATVIGCGNRAAEQALWASESASEVHIMCNKAIHEISNKWLNLIEKKDIIHICCGEILMSLDADSDGNLIRAVFFNKHGKHSYNISALYQAYGYYCDFSVWGGRTEFNTFMRMGRASLSGLANGIDSYNHNQLYLDGIQVARSLSEISK